MKAENSTDNLCDTCQRSKDCPYCTEGELIMGDGVGNDNIIEYEDYEKEE